mmetsp:Transcript_62766/g.109656  ORF Transcript_62766/g.109656 Transcript_62766/m.109656 type:complete len:93 (+) Transcript_62766:537-815(+)
MLWAKQVRRKTMLAILRTVLSHHRLAAILRLLRQCTMDQLYQVHHQGRRLTLTKMRNFRSDVTSELSSSGAQTSVRNNCWQAEDLRPPASRW